MHGTTYTLLKDGKEDSQPPLSKTLVKGRATAKKKQQFAEQLAAWLAKRGRPLALVVDPDFAELVKMLSMGLHSVPCQETLSWPRNCCTVFLAIALQPFFSAFALCF